MDIETFNKKKAELEELLRVHAKEMLTKLFSELFTALPEVKTFTWTQYTPYFNDGDPCVFRLGETHYSSKFPEDMQRFSRHGSDDGDDDCWLNTWKDREAPNRALYSAFETKFRAAKTVLEALGDHAHVTVTNREDGIRIDITEYSEHN